MPNDLTPPKTAPRGAPLGTLAKSVDAPPSTTPSKAQQNRAERYRMQRTAAKIMGRERVGKCMWSVAELSSMVRVLQRETPTPKGPINRARFEGLQTCGSVWMCPTCSATISETRRTQLNDALRAARALNLSPVLITLTTRHKAADELDTLLDALKAAKKHWHDSRTYKGLKATIVGVITATECTHGANGWHPHLHLLMFLRLPGGLEYITQQQAVHDALRAQWLASLDASGLSGNGAAFDFQPGDAAGQYVAKWGAAEELTLSAKKGTPSPDVIEDDATPATEGTPRKTSGQHPFDFLREAPHSGRARALFYTYATAFKGRRQLQWTPGLRDLLGVSDVSDEDAAKTPPTNEDAWLASMRPDEWKALRTKGRALILEAIEADPDRAPDTLESFINRPDTEA